MSPPRLTVERDPATASSPSVHHRIQENAATKQQRERSDPRVPPPFRHGSLSMVPFSIEAPFHLGACGHRQIHGNKGRIVAKVKLSPTDGKLEIGGSMLGKEYVGVYVEGLENDSRNKGDELIP
uniref:Uncharacterized protein n=1 Tax=Setaria italica TaxID=4555 RepID=K3YEH6_SETIT